MTDESKFPAVALGGGIKTLSECCRIALHQSKQSSSMLINEHSSHPGLPEGFCLGKKPQQFITVSSSSLLAANSSSQTCSAVPDSLSFHCSVNILMMALSEAFEMRVSHSFYPSSVC